MRESYPRTYRAVLRRRERHVRRHPVVPVIAFFSAQISSVLFVRRQIASVDPYRQREARVVENPFPDFERVPERHFHNVLFERPVVEVVDRGAYVYAEKIRRRVERNPAVDFHIARNQRAVAVWIPIVDVAYVEAERVIVEYRARVRVEFVELARLRALERRRVPRARVEVERENRIGEFDFRLDCVARAFFASENIFGFVSDRRRDAD